MRSPGKLSDVLAKLDPEEGPRESSNMSTPVSLDSVVSPKGFIAMIEMMREHSEYSFADDTLRGICDTVEKSGCVTERQRRAVLNIRRGARNWEDLEVDDAQ